MPNKQTEIITPHYPSILRYMVEALADGSVDEGKQVRQRYIATMLDLARHVYNTDMKSWVQLMGSLDPKRMKS